MKKLIALSCVFTLFNINVYAENIVPTIITEKVFVSTLESEPSTGGDDIEVDKYGIADSDGNILIEPILDFNTSLYPPFAIEFDENGFSEKIYDAEYYYYAGQNTLWTPANAKKILINSDYLVWKDYDTFYNNFITENRFIVKGDGKSVLIDGNMNVVTDEYSHIIELDDGKWYASTDESQINPVYDIVLNNYGEVITDFNPLTKNDISNWAEKYINTANELGITIQNKTTAFNTSFFTEKITRIEFCRLAVNTLKALNVLLPILDISSTIEDSNIFIDTKDENVLMCYEIGIISGVGESKFNPYANITREEASIILINMLNFLDVDTSEKSDLDRFVDIDEASHWAKEFILQVSSLETPYGENIMSGTSVDTFSPLSTYTVEQAVSTLVRVYDLKI